MAFAAAVNAAAADGGARMLLYVDNSLGDDISVIDLGTLKVVDTIKVGNQPHALCAPADGRRLFTTIESEKNLKIIDTLTGKITATIPVTGKPNECAATPDGRYVGVPIRDGDSLDIVDTQQKKVVKVLPVKTPHNCFNSGNNNDIYVSSMGSNEIEVVDLKKMDYSARIPTGGIPRPYAVSTDEKRLYAAVTNLHGFTIADIPARKVIARVELPPAPPLDCPLEVNTPTHGLALSPDDKQLWVTSLADGGVYVYDLVTRKSSPLIHVGKCPNWVAFSPDGKYCAVSNSDTNDCSIIDAHTRREVARVKVGKGPKRVLVVRVPVS
ncbi:MAG: cytochrome D1 domain-containing protein [Candidatus Sulfopaludibacter sp.]|nr:cytochrome D1 domain-containing protein [Candidatus Sulfopaludibacter sp.]